MLRWKTLDQVEEPPIYLEEADYKRCCFARDYIARGGFSSRGNDLVQNFKKPVDRRSKPEWEWRQAAVRQFASELEALGLAEDVAVVVVPSSKLPTDTDYDNRFEDLLEQWEKLRTAASKSLRVEAPFHRIQRVEPYHTSGANRVVAEVQGSFRWGSFQGSPSRVAIVDDVITCGTHFKACQRLIKQHAPDVEVWGVFWARTVWER